jgi:SNF2 family DNA or RNA helicase
MLRGDVARCLIVAPGSLVEQWQDELWEKFGLRFELMSRAKVEESLSGNPFLERNLLIARVDQLARADDLRAKLVRLLELAAADHSAIREAARRAAFERWSWASVADRLLALGR